MEDDSILLVRDGQIVWSLEEALTNIVQTSFVNMHLKLAGEQTRVKPKAFTKDIKTITLSERLTAQVEEVSLLVGNLAEFFSKSKVSAVTFVATAASQS